MSRAPRFVVSVVVCLLLAGLFGRLTPHRVFAAQTLTVNTTDDSGTCPDPHGLSLRCAMQQAVTDTSGDVINFNIQATSPDGSANSCAAVTINGQSKNVCTISPPQPLPTLNAASTTINGFTQAGAAHNTLLPAAGDNAVLTIDVDGAGAGGVDGLTVTGRGNTIEGLSITDFNSGIVLSGSGSTANVVNGNFLGVTPDDRAAGNNVGVSIENSATSNTIGGTAAANANVLSDNGICFSPDIGEQVHISDAAGNIVEGNLIGPDAANVDNGQAPCGAGVLVDGSATNNTIGGTVTGSGNYISKMNVNPGTGVTLDAGTGNVVAGNTIDGAGAGMYVHGTGSGDKITGNTIINSGTTSGGAGYGIEIDGASGVSISGNKIGSNASGSNRGNQSFGVYLHSGASGNSISGNTIAYNAQTGNTKAGVMIGSALTGDTNTRGNVISRNSIHNNGGLGIDLAATTAAVGVGPNCPGTAPAPPGANDYVPCPVIQFATTALVSGTACAGCAIEVFTAADDGDDYGHGEGPTYLGTAVADLTTRAWSLPLFPGQLAITQSVTATATTPKSPGPAETSEFAANVPVHPLIVTTTADSSSCPNGPGKSGYSLRCAINQANVDGAGDTIAFQIPSTDTGCNSTTLVCTIAPGAALPTLTAGTTAVYGYSQSGTRVDSVALTSGDNAVIKIRLDGASAGSADGLDVQGAHDGVQGLWITRFANGIHLQGSGAAGDLVQGNFIGAAINGTTPGGNGASGVRVDGGATAAAVGASLAGTFKSAANVIVGNGADGVTVSGGSRHLVAGNLIGVTAANGALGNAGNGISIGGGAGSSSVGGSAADLPNVIANNGHSGVLIGSSSGDTATHATVSRNSIFANAGLGIDLSPQGSVNCATSPPGPNDYLACPPIQSASTTLIQGTACAGCTVEVFTATNEADDLGHGEGKTYLGSTTASTSGTWSLSLASGRVSSGQAVTATATKSAQSDTSEFAANVNVS